MNIITIFAPDANLPYTFSTPKPPADSKIIKTIKCSFDSEINSCEEQCVPLAVGTCRVLPGSPPVAFNIYFYIIFYYSMIQGQPTL